MGHDATCYGGRSRPDNIVLDRDPAPPKKAQPPNFPLGAEVGLSLSDIVLDGDPAPLP